MADTSNLTERQRKIFEFIREKISMRGYGPTIREIGSGFDIKSPNGVMCHLKALEKKGLIKREGRSARAISIDDVRPNSVSHMEPAHSPTTLPLLGLVAAGPTIEAVAQDDTLDLAEMFCADGHFALRVRGQSMIENHIDDGDIVIIRKQNTANNGDRVVAMVDREVTLKRFVRKKDHIRLEPANGSMAPIIVEPDRDIQILGVLVGVIRKC
ncbi:transcriptional repressor LexA [Tuwongella immobilis]|uniref:LexA repressor n=1 Tax=Tuwongella immobilis TaxID=692036 RepID=A0A6C2YMV4_9BACT|nr:transcriptional repressor LexA [Tuwongella immobilis]VIP02766.1 family transcriptional regulator : LexA repressor OS=Planctomyces maris DSM 8797 GN=lexA PE=3 SV=1: LexA_DNA_bind: Peptidase_S24 [Tuwongella immobilis]VTS02387.1 family transcriptional regulator : LexA repressor OS=Planctomyces maris DSM 8797 GN=lexA PE=3 SV=1: LexA_DNA_bind: Peptidase_S24 [Tuwongella immobilis]